LGGQQCLKNAVDTSLKFPANAIAMKKKCIPAMIKRDFGVDYLINNDI